MRTLSERAKIILGLMVKGVVKDVYVSPTDLPQTHTDCPWIYVVIDGDIVSEIKFPLLCPVCDTPIHLSEDQFKQLKKVIKGGTIDDTHFMQMTTLDGLAKFIKQMTPTTINTTDGHIDLQSNIALFSTVHLWFSQTEMDSEFTLFLSPLSFDMAIVTGEVMDAIAGSNQQKL